MKIMLYFDILMVTGPEQCSLAPREFIIIGERIRCARPPTQEEREK
jgi:hypothetical protein